MFATVSAKYRNAVFGQYGLTVKTDMPYLNILRYIILNIFMYCVFIHNISIFGSFPYLHICNSKICEVTYYVYDKKSF